MSAIIRTVLGESLAVCSLLNAVSEMQDEGKPAPKSKKKANRKNNLLVEARREREEEEEIPRPGPLSIKLKNKKKKTLPATSSADNVVRSLAVPYSSMAAFRALAESKN